MEQSNRFAALDGLPSREPTPRPPYPPGGFISALDYAAMGMAANEVYHPTPSPGMAIAMEVVAAEPLQLTPTPPIYSPGFYDAAAQVVAHASIPSSDSGSYHPISPGDNTLAAAVLAAPPLSLANSSEASGGVLLYPGDEHAYPSPAPSSLVGPGVPGCYVTVGTFTRRGQSR